MKEGRRNDETEINGWITLEKPRKQSIIKIVIPLENSYTENGTTVQTNEQWKIWTNVIQIFGFWIPKYWLLFTGQNPDWLIVI